MKKTNALVLLLPVIMVLVTLCKQEVKETKIPITTDSETALASFKDGVTAFERVYLNKAMELFDQAMAEDPDFFMPAYYKSLYYKWFGNDEEFRKNAEIALQSQAELSEGELLFKAMLEQWLADPEADVTETAKQLVEMYPEDPQAYMGLATAQTLVNDYSGAVESYKKAIEITEDPAPIYNMLGYAYIELEQYEEADAAFSKYIELEPDLPNPYDSKGDYYMQIEEYGKAYESYMKAYEIDSLWSYNKAMNAKALHDSLQVEKE
ncbi:MAG: tetratricopeptide repeat protein [Bacteroidota bacterium]|nr:tetratricopeptide repeat protein [Bacteroidota bacterium]